MNINKKNVTDIIDKIGIKPIILRLCNRVFVPTADIAINKNQELISFK